MPILGYESSSLPRHPCYHDCVRSSDIVDCGSLLRIQYDGTPRHHGGLYGDICNVFGGSDAGEKDRDICSDLCVSSRL